MIYNGHSPKITVTDDALTVINSANNKVLTDSLFTVSKRFTIANGAVLNVVIDLLENGPFPTGGEFVVFPIYFESFGGGPLYVDVYQGVDSDADGVKWESIDRNFTIAATPHTTVRANPTINDPGTKMPVEFTVFSDGIGASSNIGGNSQEDLIFNGLTTTRYMFKMTNTDAVKTLQGIFTFNWYE